MHKLLLSTLNKFRNCPFSFKCTIATASPEVIVWSGLECFLSRRLQVCTLLLHGKYGGEKYHYFSLCVKVLRYVLLSCVIFVTVTPLYAGI